VHKGYEVLFKIAYGGEDGTLIPGSWGGALFDTTGVPPGFASVAPIPVQRVIKCRWRKLLVNEGV